MALFLKGTCSGDVAAFLLPCCTCGLSQSLGRSTQTLRATDSSCNGLFLSVSPGIKVGCFHNCLLPQALDSYPLGAEVSHWSPRGERITYLGNCARGWILGSCKLRVLINILSLSTSLNSTVWSSLTYQDSSFYPSHSFSFEMLSFLYCSIWNILYIKTKYLSPLVENFHESLPITVSVPAPLNAFLPSSFQQI